MTGDTGRGDLFAGVNPVPYDSADALRRSVTFAIVLVLHAVAVIRALWTGVVDAVLHTVPAPLRIDLIPYERPREPMVPVAVHWQEAAPLSVPEPQVRVDDADDSSPPLLAADPAPLLAAPAPAPAAAPVEPARAPTGPARPVYVPGGMDRYPAESRRARESGSPTIRIAVLRYGSRGKRGGRP